jgi:hypothetical protein
METNIKKIFEVREYSTGDWTDKGDVTNYILSDKTSDELRAENKHFFMVYNEITQEQFDIRKQRAINELKMFDL